MQNKDNSKRCANQGKTVYSKGLIEFNFRFHTNRVSTKELSQYALRQIFFLNI